MKKIEDKKEKKLEQQNKRYRKELNELKSINERIEKIHKHEEQKGAMIRFKTIYTQINQFDNDTQKLLKNLDKKFNKTIEFYNNPNIHEQTIK